jgi:hypothetical protein
VKPFSAPRKRFETFATNPFTCILLLICKTQPNNYYA